MTDLSQYVCELIFPGWKNIVLDAKKLIIYGMDFLLTAIYNLSEVYTSLTKCGISHGISRLS